MFASTIPEMIAGTATIIGLAGTAGAAAVIRDHLRPRAFGRHLVPAQRGRIHRLIYPNG